eukprot:TRINITY_DN2521_c0_g1_i2.p1 TRINITY_DN2521_c0_g1~~TRINITY_DN2521_c0_g1_i2.p1  ORF type:complete len:690 (+),score=95.84 TRINITY_DN2521_c0_g1_i2:213-2072(+)
MWINTSVDDFNLVVRHKKVTYIIRDLNSMVSSLPKFEAIMVFSDAPYPPTAAQKDSRLNFCQSFLPEQIEPSLPLQNLNFNPAEVNTIKFPPYFQYASNCLLLLLQSSNTTKKIETLFSSEPKITKAVSEMCEKLDKGVIEGVSTDIDSLSCLLMLSLSKLTHPLISESLWKSISLQLGTKAELQKLLLLLSPVDLALLRQLSLLTCTALKGCPKPESALATATQKLSRYIISTKGCENLPVLLQKTSLCLLLPLSYPNYLIPGETILLCLDNVICSENKTLSDPHLCELWCTNFRIVFKFLQKNASQFSVYSQIEVPLHCLEQIHQHGPPQTGFSATLELLCKDFRAFCIWFPVECAVLHFCLFSLLERYMTTTLLKFSCLSNEGTLVPTTTGYFYSPKKELEDILEICTTKKWRITNVNIHYLLCVTYPSLLIVPSALTDDWIKSRASHWKYQRFPVLIFHYKANNAALLRSNSCTDLTTRETFLKALRDVSSSTLILVKTTPRESPNIQCLHLDLPETSVFREGFRQLQESLSAPLPEPSPKAHKITSLPFNGKWYWQLKALGVCAGMIASLLESGNSILLEHSQDKTYPSSDIDSALLSLVQLIVCPTYRTFLGH